jgi:hypothetical protein
VCFLINAGIVTETCYLKSSKVCHALLFCDYRKLGNFKDLPSIFEFADSVCIFYENNSILLFAANCSE